MQEQNRLAVGADLGRAVAEHARPGRDQPVAGRALDDIAYDAVIEAYESMPKPRRRDPDAVGEAVRLAVRAAIASRWGKKPMCYVHVLTV